MRGLTAEEAEYLDGVVPSGGDVSHYRPRGLVEPERIVLGERLRTRGLWVFVREQLDGETFDVARRTERGRLALLCHAAVQAGVAA